jgi:DNA-binding GntR family transcriptional regulator
LALPRRQPVRHLRRVRFARNQPLAILENHVPQHLFDIGSGDLAARGLYQLFRSAGVRLKVAKQRIGAREGTDDECRLLDEPRQSPLLTMERLAHDDLGRPVEWGRHVYRASRYDFAVTLVGR